MSVYILDTETTGTSKADQVIELAYLQCLPLHKELDKPDDYLVYIEAAIGETYSEQYLPSCPINPHAHAVHGISRIALMGKLPSSSVIYRKMLSIL